ncbi:MAG TPA: hypothetical protein VE974_25940 [Thermoanaerobaculia bacterium]|nr:hypothetical protein [Thermoanaerobaculia bacterium]
MRARALFLSLLLSFSAAAQTRWYAGQFSTNWNTNGYHGHDQPCLFTPDCDDDDFVRANLDNSIGFRAGAERDYGTWRGLRLVGGADLSYADTEYNISQSNLGILSGAVAGGVEVDVWRVALGARVAAGPIVTTDLTVGAQAYGELALTVPVTPRAALRVGFREVFLAPAYDGELDFDNSFHPDASLRSRDVSLLLVATPGTPGQSPWQLVTGTGMSSPYGRGLSKALFTRLGVQRALTPSMHGQFSWTSSAHESYLPGVFMGFPGNFRSKTIDAFGLSVHARRELFPELVVFAKAGAEAADWTDEHGLLIDDGEVVDGGFEVGVVAGGGVRYQLRESLGVEAFAEHVWWPGIGVGEVRTGLALVID